MRTASPTTPTTEPRERRRHRGVVYLKFGLAGAALLGIGLAATSASWSNDAWFSANATGASFEIEGLDGTNWVPADNEKNAIVIPGTDLQNLVPGVAKSFDIQIRNTGTVTAAITSTYKWTSVSPANDFVAAPAVAFTNMPASLPAGTPGTATTVTVTVTPPSTWDLGNQGKSENLVITFTGTVGS